MYLIYSKSGRLLDRIADGERAKKALEQWPAAAYIVSGGKVTARRPENV